MPAKKISYYSSWSTTMTGIKETFTRWGVRDWDIESPASRRGDYTRTSGVPEERLVRLTFRHPKGHQIELESAAQACAADNLRVLYLAVEGLRKNEVRGLSDVMSAAYLQLAPPAGSIRRDPHEVLGVRKDSPPEVVEAAYKALAKLRHPDVGGSAEQMAELNAARDAVLGSVI